MTHDDTDDDELMSAEEIACREEMERFWEAEAEQTFGPPAERKAKNQKYVAELCARHTEPVVRNLLVALSRLERPHSARDLAEFDLMTADLLGELPGNTIGRPRGPHRLRAA